MVAAGLALGFGGGSGGTLLGGWAAAGALLGYPLLALGTAGAAALLLRPLGPAAAAAGALGTYHWELLAGLGLGRGGRWAAGPAALPPEALVPERPLLLALGLLGLLYGLYRSSGPAAADPRLGLLAALTLGVAAAGDFLTLYMRAPSNAHRRCFPGTHPTKVGEATGGEASKASPPVAVKRPPSLGGPTGRGDRSMVGNGEEGLRPPLPLARETMARLTNPYQSISGDRGTPGGGGGKKNLRRTPANKGGAD